MKHHIGKTSNGVSVYAQLIGSQAGKRIAQQPQLLTLAKEMFSEVALHDSEIRMEYDINQPTGYDFTVETTEQDTIFYGRFLKDDVYTRFVKNGKPRSTTYLSVVLSKQGDNSYELSDIWIGCLRPPRPGSANETAESKPFWLNHARVLDNQTLQMKTVTKTCPY